jgi:hypothetical protein
VAIEVFGDAVMVRIERLTLLLGLAGTVWAAFRWGWRGAAGLALGALLSWVNFRWLKGGVHALGMAATAAQGSSPASRVSLSAYMKFIGRFGLLLGAVYVILTRSSLLAVGVLTGLFASAAAVILALLFELLRSGVRQAVGRSS